MEKKEYIERGAVLALKQPIGACGMDICSAEVKDIPAADVVEVVRCKDCKWWWDNTGITKRPKGFCYEHGMCTNGDDFCSRGERKEATL